MLNLSTTIIIEWNIMVFGSICRHFRAWSVTLIDCGLWPNIKYTFCVCVSGLIIKRTFQIQMIYLTRPFIHLYLGIFVNLPLSDLVSFYDTMSFYDDSYIRAGSIKKGFLLFCNFLFMQWILIHNESTIITCNQWVKYLKGLTPELNG